MKINNIKLSIKQEIENKFFDGWSDLYGDLFSKSQMVNKEDWDKFWKEHLLGGEND